ncbi:YbaB/EbfC family nucleoid-associated protein [Gordonia sp. CPCC 205515]|uniref:YbaB/EbfC family nucleoid-associated protein n=1 Tax=Gordonia sp. CPCC 205515 TaxID=3140791 RepID=UPI003AF33AE9
MDEIEARASAQLDRMHELNDALSSIRVRETSDDGLVTVQVDGTGALTGLWLADAATALGGQRLGDLIVATAGHAAAQAFARHVAITDEFRVSFGDLVATRPPNG